MEAKAKHCKMETSETGQEIKLHEEEPQLDPANFARSYQLEALERAIERNTIAFLETGSGKTLIAVMLLRAYAHAVRKPSDSIAVFLVPTVVLVTQQARVLEMHTDLKVGQFYGEMGVDFWSAETWKKQLEQYEVFSLKRVILEPDPLRILGLSFRSGPYKYVNGWIKFLGTAYSPNHPPSFTLSIESSFAGGRTLKRRRVRRQNPRRERWR